MSLDTTLGALKRGVVSFLFPPVCLICGGGGPQHAGLCTGCARGFLHIPRTDICNVCGNPLAGGSVCGECLAGRYFSSARSVFFFTSVAAEAAKLFKYGGRFSLGKLFCRLVMENFPAGLGGFDVIVPVPLHINRLRAREFNQSGVISSMLAGEAGKTHAPFALERMADISPQASFARKSDRKRNVRNTFGVPAGRAGEIEGADVLLFDDIYTTGATVDECSKALLKAGAARVSALTVFRTPI